MKVKIVKNIAPLSDNEINLTKDFQSILKRRNQYLSKVQRQSNFRLKLLISILILSSLGLTIYFSENLSFNDKDLQKNKFIAPVGQLPIDNSELNLTKESEALTVTRDNKKINKVSSSSEYIAKKEAESELTKEKSYNSSKVEDSSNTELEKKANSLVYAYEEAYPMVGMDSLYQYLEQNIQYPQDVSVADSIEGTSVVYFTIDRAGKPTDVKVSNSLGAEFDRQCIRLINNMPLWQPAKVNGKPTLSNMSVPLRFNIK